MGLSSADEHVWRALRAAALESAAAGQTHSSLFDGTRATPSHAYKVAIRPARPWEPSGRRRVATRSSATRRKQPSKNKMTVAKPIQPYAPGTSKVDSRDERGPPLTRGGDRDHNQHQAQRDVGVGHIISERRHRVACVRNVASPLYDEGPLVWLLG